MSVTGRGRKVGGFSESSADPQTLVLKPFGRNLVSRVLSYSSVREYPGNEVAGFRWQQIGTSDNFDLHTLTTRC